jgi:hypothetical protein
MKDFVGIIIYLLLAVIGILASVYRQKNKRGSVKPPPIPPAPFNTETGGSYETEFDPFAGFFGEEPAAAKEEYVVAEEESKTEEMLAEKKADNKSYVEGEAVFKETERNLISGDTSYESPDVFAEAEYGEGRSVTEEEKPAITDYSESAEKKEEFDLRTAIIYSEILKRNEY